MSEELDGFARLKAGIAWFENRMEDARKGINERSDQVDELLQSSSRSLRNQIQSLERL